MRKRVTATLLIGIGLLCSFYSFPGTCISSSRATIPTKTKAVYDSLRQTELYKWHGLVNFISDSVQITDTARIRKLSIDEETRDIYYPVYLQFHGKYESFVNYVLVFDNALDSVITCDKKVQLYYAHKCDFCDSGFWAGTSLLPTQFCYYRFQEIYGAFFSFPGINEVQVFVNGENKTYLPYASDLSVYAPGKSMRKKWFVKNVDYAQFFPVDFPSDLNGDFILDDNGDFTWKEGAADRMTR